MFRTFKNSSGDDNYKILTNIKWTYKNVQPGVTGPTFTTVGRVYAFVIMNMGCFTNINPTTGVPDATFNSLWRFDTSTNTWISYTNNNLVVTDNTFAWNGLGDRWEWDCYMLYYAVGDI